MFSVAWDWATDESIPSDVKSAAASYKEKVRNLDHDRSDCHAVPEIAAAIQSFVTSREALPGIYVYFDIGGGTVDGVTFKYLNWNGERRINFYSGKVAPLGVVAIASRVAGANLESVEASIIRNKLTPTLREKFEPSRKEVQQLVADVIMTAKRKDDRNWQRDVIQDTSRPRRTLARLDPSDMIPLSIFVGGGGVGSKWYEETILSTHGNFAQINAGVPPYELTEVPKPDDLDMNGLDDDGFRRLAIAYGLSVPYGEGPEIGLPSHFAPVERSLLRQPNGLVDYYLDSKDAYD